jgi:hypothetical protein
MSTPAYIPTKEEVAALILSRTKDNFGHELGTFTADTRPTNTQADELTEMATNDVTTEFDTDLPTEAMPYVKEAIALRAAMLIERSYYSEQINSNHSAYNALREDYERLMGDGDTIGVIARAIEREAQEELTGEVPMTNNPSYSFPPADLRYGLGRPL